MNSVNAIKAYTNVGIESSLDSADPHKLILMLYQGALLAIVAAKRHMLRKETAQKGKSISHAIAIIESGLLASLDITTGGELAKNLASLYEYMSSRLISSNLKNDVEILDEVALLLTDLKGAWESVRQPTLVPAGQTTPVSSNRPNYRAM